MRRDPKKNFAFLRPSGCQTLLFWPLIVAGGRLVARVILNLWNMFES